MLNFLDIEAIATDDRSRDTDDQESDSAPSYFIFRDECGMFCLKISYTTVYLIQCFV